MADMDYSVGNKIVGYLDARNIEYKDLMSNSIRHILVYNGDDSLAIFMIYGFFEEYIIYYRVEHPEDKYNSESWFISERNELNFTEYGDILAKIGISNE